MKSKNNLLVLISAVLGGLLGHFIFFWVADQGFYGLILPGAAVGIGAGFVKTRSKSLALVCGLLALTAGILTEWRYAPFIKDRSIIYFLTHLFELKPITLVMIAVGSILGFWIPLDRTPRSGKTIEKNPE